MATHLSNIEDVYVEDAAVGSHGASELRVRAITDSVALTAALRNLLVRVPKMDPHYTHPITVLAATGLPGKDSFICTQPTVEEDGAVSAIKILVGGNVSFEALQTHIAAAAETLFTQGDGDVVPLGCAASSTGAVVFTETPSAALALGAAKLNGAHQHLWTPSGLSRVFGGAALDAKAQPAAKGDVVFDKTLVTRLAHPDNVVAHPSKVVFVGSKKGKASAADAAGLLQATGASDAVAQKFGEYVAQHNTAVEVVGSAADAMKAL